MEPEDSRRYRKHLRGWLSYAFASEVFVIVSLTLFLPICLEQFARDNGYLLPDRTEPCSGIIQLLDAEPGRCVVKVGWLWVDTASFSLYTHSMSVAIQALTVISMGGIADHPTHRKRVLLSFAFMGAGSASLFLFLTSTSPLWWLSALLAICANVGLGASTVAMNAYLPSLSREAPSMVTLREELEALRDAAPSHLDGGHDSDPDPTPPDRAEGEETALLQPRSLSVADASPTSELALLTAAYESRLSQNAARISSFGVALGYAAGITLLLLTLIPVTYLHGSTWSLRLAIGLSGFWWAIGCFPVMIWLPGSDDAKVQAEEIGWSVETEQERPYHIWVEVKKAWIRLGDMLRRSEVSKLVNTFRYLAAWFLLSDGFTTITSTAVLFGKTSLHMTPSQLIVVGVIAPFTGILGSLAWPFLQRRYGWTNLQVLVGLVFAASFVPAYGCLGFLPILKRWGVGGLRTRGEMFALASYFGSLYGAFHSYARASFTELIPPGEEARWFAMYSITDKSSSFIGPLLVGLIADVTGNIRYAFFFLIFMVWSAVPVLLWVDVEEGKKDARQYVRGRRESQG